MAMIVRIHNPLADGSKAGTLTRQCTMCQGRALNKKVQCFQVLACSSYQADWGRSGAILWLTRIHMLCKLVIILVKVIEVN